MSGALIKDDGRIRIWVNSNAKMSRGRYAAAAVHAALTAAGVHPGVPVIVLGGQRDHIEKMRTVVRDAGRTEVEPGTPTAGTDAVFEKTQDANAIRAAIDIASTVYGDYDDAQGALSDIHMLLAPAAEGGAFEKAQGPTGEKCPIITTVGGDPWHGCPQQSGHDGRHEFSIRLYGAYPEYGIEANPEPQGEPKREQIHCDYCGDSLPSVQHRSHIPTTPDLQRLGFDADKVVCPDCARKPQGEPSDALNLDYLETVAKAATPGPWTEFDEEGEAYSRPPATGAFLVDYGVDEEQKMRDIRFIATADPQTILALIAALRAAGGAR